MQKLITIVIPARNDNYYDNFSKIINFTINYVTTLLFEYHPFVNGSIDCWSLFFCTNIQERVRIKEDKNFGFLEHGWIFEWN